MVVKLKIPWKRILKDLRFVMVYITIYISVISIFDFFLPLDSLHVPITLITIPGTIIALLLAFRTNSAYGRWWEARIVWGSIVNDSRTWVRQLITFVENTSEFCEDQEMIEQMAKRQIYWNYALTAHLRKVKLDEQGKTLLDPAEWESIKKRSNVPNAILYQQAKDLKYLWEMDMINEYQFVSLDNTLTRLTDSMGKCERIKNTVFPTSYSLLVDFLIYLWILFLPLGLIENIGFVLIPTTISLAFSFLAVDRISYYMQDPFDNLPSDTPMTALSRTIEINILEELDEKNIPDPIRPNNGVLM
jgi:putative membrane protein